MKDFVKAMKGYKHKIVDVYGGVCNGGAPHKKVPVPTQ